MEVIARDVELLDDGAMRLRIILRRALGEEGGMWLTPLCLSIRVGSQFYAVHFVYGTNMCGRIVWRKC